MTGSQSNTITYIMNSLHRHLRFDNNLLHILFYQLIMPYWI